MYCAEIMTNNNKQIVPYFIDLHFTTFTGDDRQL